MKRKKLIAGMLSVAFAIMMSIPSIAAFAAESTTDISAEDSSYSYLAGRQRSISRNEVYAQAAMMEDEEERQAFLIANGIADTEYSEEAAVSYSYVSGRERGAAYRTSNVAEQSETQSSYSYVAGSQRGSSYPH